MASFASQIRDFRIDFTNLSDETYRITVIKIFGQVVRASPVQESPATGGRFRGNWFVTIGIPSTQVTTAIRPLNQVNREIEQTVNQAANARIFWLTNNLPYAETIEFGGYRDGPKTVGGFSRQAPQGVVRITERNFSRIFNENAARLNRL